MKVKIAAILLLLTASFLLYPKPAHASILDTIVEKVMDILPGGDKKDKTKEEITMESKISLAPDGDIDKNNQIDAGDIVRFEYLITNNTNEDLTYATVETNVTRESINYIHNIYGVTGFDDDAKKITIKNLRVPKGLTVTIRFDARVNYFTDKDEAISTQPELLTKDKKSLVKIDKVSKEVKKISKEKLNKVTSSKTSDIEGQELNDNGKK